MYFFCGRNELPYKTVSVWLSWRNKHKIKIYFTTKMAFLIKTLHTCRVVGIFYKTKFSDYITWTCLHIWQVKGCWFDSSWRHNPKGICFRGGIWCKTVNLNFACSRGSGKKVAFIWKTPLLNFSNTQEKEKNIIFEVIKPSLITCT